MILSSGITWAQFNSSPYEAPGVKWDYVATPNFQVIYPQGCDSLGITYLRELEKYRGSVGMSLGQWSGQYQRKPLPVFLYPRNAASNGAVTWTPRRMELYTIPQWNSADPFPWHTQLAIHEGRHAAQMQLGYRRVFMPFRYILGEIIPGAAAVYPGSLLLEGDAVVAETALSISGRGRKADFLGEYFYNLDNGMRRSWMSWRNGSIYRSAPNHYAWGYFYLSGMRTLYGNPLFMSDYFDYVSRRPYDPWPLRRIARKTSGKKWKESYNEVVDYQYAIWKANADDRGPFPQTKTLYDPGKTLTIFSKSHTFSSHDSVLWLKSDLYHLPTLHLVSNEGKLSKVRTLGYGVGDMNISADEKRVLWNSTFRHPRWGQVVGSRIFSTDLESGRTRTITRKGIHLYPVELPDGVIMTITALPKGGHNIDFISHDGRKTLESWPVPSGIQPLSLSWAEKGNIYCAAISDKGMGIWEVTQKEWKNILPEIPVTIEKLSHLNDTTLCFKSDRNGVSEFYLLDTENLTVRQVTNTRYGGGDFAMESDGAVQFAQVYERGTRLMRISADSLSMKPVKWMDWYHNPIADSLSAQERRLAAMASDISGSNAPAGTLRGRYRKGAHFMRVHSWAPCFVNMDIIENISFDNIKNAANLGAMVFFQNSMSTFSGWAGYKAAPDKSGKWFHSGHLNLTYKGLWPVFEAQLHVGERFATNTVSVPDEKNPGEEILVRQNLNAPLVRASLSTYVPLSWNLLGWNYGVIPQVSAAWRNDRFEGRQSVNFITSLRAYAIQSTPSGCVYPRWGAGAQANWSGPLAFVYAYGYLPGIGWGQGIKMSAVSQFEVGSGDAYGYTYLMPRGFVNSPYYNAIAIGSKFTLDYAAPFPMGDWHIADAFYCRRGIVTPHFDYSMINNRVQGGLWSAGMSFEMEFGTFAWIRTPVTLGVTASYNGGPFFDRMIMDNRWYVGAIFNINIPN